MPPSDQNAARRDDLADARAIATVAAALHEWQEATGKQAPRRPLREAFWFLWESPRLPADRVRGKYPRSYRWSPDAARAHLAGEDKGQLVIEHSPPLNYLPGRLIEDSTLSAEQVLDELRSLEKPVVMTKKEHARLADHGLASAGGASRYRDAGIEIERFAPLAEFERASGSLQESGC